MGKKLLVSKIKPRLEKEIQKEILCYLKLRKDIVAEVWRNNHVGIYDKKKDKYRRNPLTGKGIPDICGYMVNGKALFIEVKRSEKDIGKAISDNTEQVQFINRAIYSNCIATISCSVDDVRKLLLTFNQ